ncbi:MAG TPA: hypothetical protein VG963_00845 [Polyangiaceae bacterium]|nr:hypothetical protein [Polyangiaceae bacterium]
MAMRLNLSRLLLMLTVMAAACGKEAGPTSPSSARSFLEGTWTGTVTIERVGEAAAAGPVTWTFEPVDGTNLQTFRVTIRSQHAWLPITTTVTSAITPSNQPPARISTQGEYQSPRGCTGTLLSVGDAEARTINADFSGVDCATLANSTFTGRVTLTKTS